MKKQVMFAALVGAMISLAGCGAATETTSDATVSEESVAISTEAEETAETVSDNTEEDTAEAETSDSGIELGVAPGEESDTSATESADLTAGTFTAADEEITVNGVTLKLGDDFLPNVDAVGEAEIVEGQACLDGGYDTNYYYNGEDLVVYTIAKSGQQVIYDIYITSGDYQTTKGAQVGVTTKDDLYEMYGDATDGTGATQKFSVDGSEISMDFTFGSDGVLESIDIIDNSVNG